MIVVRFPDGAEVHYWKANFWEKRGETWQLFEDSNTTKGFIALIQPIAGMIISDGSRNTSQSTVIRLVEELQREKYVLERKIVLLEKRLKATDKKANKG